MRRDPCYVEELACVVLYAGKQNQGYLVGVLINTGEDVLRRDDMVLVRLDQDHGVLRIIAVPCDLRLDRVLLHSPTSEHGQQHTTSRRTR